VSKVKKKLVRKGDKVTAFVTEEFVFGSVMGATGSYHAVTVTGLLIPEPPALGTCGGLPIHELFGTEPRAQTKYLVTVEVVEAGPPLGKNPWWKPGRKS
jgi:hypothetical protein